MSQVLYTGIGIDPSLCKNVIGQLPTDAVDVGQANLYALFTGKVNTGNTCHSYKYLQVFSLRRVCETSIGTVSAPLQRRGDAPRPVGFVCTKENQQMLIFSNFTARSVCTRIIKQDRLKRGADERRVQRYANENPQRSIRRSCED